MTSRAGLSPTEKALMLLSRETEGGLFMTGIVVTVYNIMHAFFVMLMRLNVQVHSHAHVCFVLFHYNSEVICGTGEVPLAATCNPLSACLNQDPLESYFGNVRAAGWRPFLSPFFFLIRTSFPSLYSFNHAAAIEWPPMDNHSVTISISSLSARSAEI